MSRPVYLSILLAALAVPSAFAGSGTLLLPTGLSMTSAGWADTSGEEPAPVIATGDFNRDGIPDMVEAASSAGEDRPVLTVLLGQPDGTFQRVASHNLIDSEPRALVVGDFNRDGNLDVIVGDAKGALLEFLGDGRGNLAAAGSIGAAGSVVSIATGHFTHSGNLDLVVSDFHSNSAEILLGAGDGSFRLAWSFQLPRRGARFHIATADFNRDGVTDLVITGEDDENYEVMLGNGNGTFTYAPELSHLRDPNSYCPS